MSKERRRFSRLPVKVRVQLLRGSRVEELTTGDISRHGAYILSEHAPSERALLQLRFLPKGGPEFDVMCMVTRRVLQGDEHPLGPGMGVDFFALDKAAKDVWDEYILRLESTMKARGLFPRDVAPSQAEEIVDDLVVDDDDIVPSSSTSIRRAYPRTRACFMVHLDGAKGVETFLSRDVSQGGIFLETPLPHEVGAKVILIIVHPQSQEEFELGGVITRVATGGIRGLGIRFSEMTEQRRQRLTAFLSTGIHALQEQDDTHNGEAKESTDLAELEMGAASFLQKGDAAEAVKMLREAVLLAPERISIHEKLCEAYGRIGNIELARSHERVALSLAHCQHEICGV